MLSYTCLSSDTDITRDRFGARARRLYYLNKMGMPVPRACMISVDDVRQLAAGRMVDARALLAEFGDRGIVSVRSSPWHWDWGGPQGVLNVGLNDHLYGLLRKGRGAASASALYLRFILQYSVDVMRLDAEAFEHLPAMADHEAAIAAAHDIYRAEMDEDFPQDPADQLCQVLRSMARAWEGTTARILRQAKGAPEDAGLGLIVQRMAFGLGGGHNGAGVIQFVNPANGAPKITGRYMQQGQGRDALTDDTSLYLSKDKRGRSLEEVFPEAFSQLQAFGAQARMDSKDELVFDFTIEDGQVWLLDAAPAQRSARAAMRIAVDLERDGAITKREALLRITPQQIPEMLHPQIDPTAPRDVVAQGIAASPGAAAGRVVFSAGGALNMQAQEEPCILVRLETGPEDIRGMHMAAGVLTKRGGMTSHAAVIARSLGLPCVVGASHVQIDPRAKLLITDDGREFREGDWMTVDGSSGCALSGQADMVLPELDEGFNTLLDWADGVGGIHVRANADTPADARVARGFGAAGIGLCRTEHMFFEEDRLVVMREMIFADEENDRRAALDRLLPMQRSDFAELFGIMQGQPVCIRLFDPPLHEFLPHERDSMQALAEALDLPVSRVTARIEELREFNPMLGLRGVRLGIVMPEIYEMQARAIFEATIEASRDGDPVVPEIMIPLVSAYREVELVKSSIDAVASSVQSASGVGFKYRLGVMVETPRAALRAGDLARSAAFLSFGTNDLTQMTYGLSRDDAGRFMRDYVNSGVYPEDPFHSLDTEGVGELLRIAAERGRATRPEITLSVCGEHGGDPESIGFCVESGFDYVSCSPFRVPVARLSAAHHVLKNG